MPEITRDVVHNIARLAHLHFEKSEEERMGAQLEKILGYVRKLNEVETAGVPETAHALRVQNIWREDLVRPCLPRDEALAAAPAVEDGAFRVPRIIA